jgi:predicted alpha/beta superfamily hydrolase
MGGLISLYAILEYPNVFGGAGVFSPAFWVAPKIYDDIRAKGSEVKGSIYFMCGKLEGSSKDDQEKMVSDMLRAFQLMASVSKARMETVIRDDGRHNEATWRKEFPVFYKWLLGNSHR